MRLSGLRAAVAAATMLLGACVARQDAVVPRTSEPVPEKPVAPPQPPPPPANAAAAGVTLVSAAATVPQPLAGRAYSAFKKSCPVVVKRADASGLTRPSDWAAACADVINNNIDDNAPAFFRDRFEAVRVGDGKAFATGYYEPEIAGSRVRAPGYEVPIYRTPPDLVRGALPDGKTGRGRYDEAGVFTLYHDRAAIDAGALADRGLEIGWAADPVELFFLQIQGSGRLRLPDGDVMRIGYADQNGREYLAIGRILKERGLLGPGQTSMQGIVAWLRANPEQGRAIMEENKSYVFFSELTGAGPLGSIGVAVTPNGTVAVDPKFVPYGAPVLLNLDRPEATGIWVAQDTGGAIRGANRFDTFWGAGEDAKRVAGGMQAHGDALILVPTGTVARLREEAKLREEAGARAQR